MLLAFNLISVQAENKKLDAQSLNEAFTMVKNEQYLEAITKLEQIVKAHKNFYEAYFLLGKSYFNVQDYDKAKQALLSSQNLKTNFLPGLLLLADVNMKLEQWADVETNLKTAALYSDDKQNIFIRLGNLYLLEQKTNQALKYYENSYNLNKTKIEALYPVFQIYINQKEYRKVLKKIKSIDKKKIRKPEKIKTLEEYERRTQFLIALKKAEMMFEKNKIKGSLQYYKTANDLYPNQEKILIQMGFCYYRLHQYEKADHLISPLIKSNSSLSTPYRLKAMILLSRKKYKEAKSQILLALNKDTENAKNYLWAGKVQEGLKNISKAKEYYKQTIELNPMEWEGYLNLSVILASERHYNDSITNAETANTIHPRADIFKFIKQVKSLNYLQIGNTKFDQSDFESALKNYTLSLKYKYSDTAFINKANTLTQLKKYSKSIKMFKKMIKAKKAGPSVYESLAVAYQKNNQQEEAGKIYTELETQGRNNTDFYLNSAVFYEQNQKLDKAIDLYKKALSVAKEEEKQNIKKQLTKVYYNKGIDFYNVGNITNAEQSLRQSLSLYSNYIPAKEALKLILLAKDSAHIQSVMKKGIEQYKSKKYNAAIRSFQNILNLKKNFPEALYNLSQTYYAVSNYFQSEYLVKQYLKVSTNRFDGVVLLAHIYQKKDKKEEAKNLLLEEAKAGHNKGDYYFILGQILEEENNRPSAIKYYEKAIALDPHNFEARNNLGNLYYRQKEYTKAQQQYSIVLKQNPDNDVALYNTAYIYYKKENFKEAVKLFQQFDDKFTGYSPLYFNLARSLYYKGDYNDSLKYAKQADKSTTKTNILYKWGLANIYTKLYETTKDKKLKEQYRKKSVNLCKTCIYKGDNPNIAAMARGKIIKSIKGNKYLYNPPYSVPKKYPLLLKGKYLFFYDDDTDSFKKINKETDNLLWQTKLYSPPTSHYEIKDKIYIPLTTGDLLILDRETGKELYKLSVQSDKIVPSNNGVLFKNQNLLSFYSNDNKKWVHTNNANEEQPKSIFIEDKHIYIIFEQKIFTLDISSGETLWSYKAQKNEKIQNLYADKDFLLLNCIRKKKTFLTGLDAFTGKELWSKKIKSEIYGTPKMNSNFIIYLLAAKNVYVLKKSGENLWNKKFSVEISSLTIQNKILFVGNSKNKIEGYDIKSGKKILDYTLPKQTIKERAFYSLYYKK